MFYFSLFLLLTFTLKTLQAPLTWSSIHRRAFSDGPVIYKNFPDPTFINVNGTYYAFSTTSGGLNIPIATSDDFQSWTVTDSDALPKLPTWAKGATWAPDVVQIGDGSFVMYFAAATSQNPEKHCVGTATSLNVEGPYTANEIIFSCPLKQGGALDAAGFTDSDGLRYVVYKIDGNSLGGGGSCGNGNEQFSTPIMLQAVESDGITPKGNPLRILDRDAADGPLVEAPSLIRSSEGTYVLFFSSNCFNGPYYDTSYATASAVFGPYTKSDKPLLLSGDNNGALNSPGGATVGQDGQLMVFHSDSEPGSATVRQMWTAEIIIKGTTVSIS